MTELDPDPTPTVNVPLLRKAIEFVEESASRSSGSSTAWHQTLWSGLQKTYYTEDEVQSQNLTPEACGTAFCVAGYVTQLEPGYASQVVVDDLYDSSYFTNNAGETYQRVRLRESINDNEIINGHQHEIARKALGLTDDQANRLFHPNNTAEEIRQMAEHFAGEKL